MGSSSPRVLEEARRQAGKGPLSSVFSKWCTTVLVDLVHEEKEPIEWRSLHVGAERGVNRPLETKIFQRKVASG